MDKDLVSNVFNDIHLLIEKARQYVSNEFNATHVMLNWHIGSRVNQEILKNKRAEYGQKLISQLAKQLKTKYGSGFDKTSLSRMIKFSKLYPDQNIVKHFSQSITWTHIIQLIAIEDDLKRDFYIEMCRVENWGIRSLRKKIDGMLYERTALAKKPEHIIRQDLDKIREDGALTPDFVFHDPCFLTFTGLKKDYSESDFENSILDEITNFIQELGSDFCFVARQKRMSTAKKDRYLDLLFFHRSMRRLIGVELKTETFKPAHKVQMEWYLNWLDKHERKPGENRPLGIILCADKDQDDIEYLELKSNGIHVAQYLTELPPKEVLEAELKKAIAIAREKHEKIKLLKK